jgi:hypothetical protein
MPKKILALLAVLSFLCSACGGWSSYEWNAPKTREFLNTWIDEAKYDDLLGMWGEPYSIFQGDEIFIVTWSSEKVGPVVTVASPVGNSAVVSTRQNRTGWKLTATFEKTSRVFKKYIYEVW